MSRPLIAMSTRPRKAGEIRGWGTTAAAAMQSTYLDAVWRAGGHEMMVAPRLLSHHEALDVVSRADGLVLVGGGDMDPATYGQAPHPSVYDIEPASDRLEIGLALAALELGVPLLAVCRGMQVLNVALGGTLHQHITREAGFGSHGDPQEGAELHAVDVVAGTKLAEAVSGASRISECWSFHHQALGIVADRLVISARSDDGTVEGVEVIDAEWAVGVQWHPERTAHRDPVQQAVFDALVVNAGLRMRRRSSAH